MRRLIVVALVGLAGCGSTGAGATESWNAILRSFDRCVESAATTTDYNVCVSDNNARAAEWRRAYGGER